AGRRRPIHPLPTPATPAATSPGRRPQRRRPPRRAGPHPPPDPCHPRARFQRPGPFHRGHRRRPRRHHLGTTGPHRPTTPHRLHRPADRRSAAHRRLHRHLHPPRRTRPHRPTHHRNHRTGTRVTGRSDRRPRASRRR